MKIELAGWESQGLRCPDVSVNLNNSGKIPPVTLIQMPNGTGKTTTLNMLRASMSGEADRWGHTRIRSYRRPGAENETGQFVVHLLIDDRLLAFELTLNFEEGTARYRTTSPGSGGVTHGWHPPAQAHRFLRENFVQLFVFDGEFANKLLDSRESEAEKAIDALCQLYLLDEIGQEAEATWQRATKDKSSKTGQGLTKWEGIQGKIQKKIYQVMDAKKEANLEIEKCKKIVSVLKEKIDEKVGGQKQLRDKYDIKKQEETEAQKEVDNCNLEVMNLLRQPQTLTSSFATSLVSLKDQLDKLKLPSSTSRQFFIELLDEAECICGRPMNEAVRTSIEAKAKRYLGEETSGILNSLKEDIESYVQQEESPKAEDLTLALQNLDAAVSKMKAIESVTRALWDQLIEQGDDQLKKWQQDLVDKGTQFDKLRGLLREIDRDPLDDDDENTHCLKSLRKILREAERKISEITGTLELREKTETLQIITKKALLKSRGYIRQELTEKCNERLKVILSRSPLQVENIGQSLKLKNQEGASVGQTLSVGYTFLTSLLHRGKHQFPLVVDSPANPLSIEVRREIGKLVPELCEQFIGFTISSERAGFVEALDSHCDDVEYLTLFRKGEGTDGLMAGIEGYDHVQNDTCALVRGKEYFCNFDIEEES